VKIQIELKGTSPLLMHNPRMVDPDFELNRIIKGLTGKRKKTDEDLRQIEKLEWYGGLYEENDVIVQPTSKPRKCFIETAKISKQGKMMERAVSFASLNVPLIYDGPKKIDDVFANKRYHSRLSVGVGNKRVMRVRPSFFPWALVADGVFIEDVGLNLDELENIVEQAGIVVGIGDNRVNGYGRFTGHVKAVK
jgi:hypothetical protein